MKWNKNAQKTFDRLKGARRNYGKVDKQAAIEGATQYYQELGLQGPPIIVVKSWREAWREARSEAWSEALREARSEALSETLREAWREARREAWSEALSEARREARREAWREALSEARSEALSEAWSEALSEAWSEAWREAWSEALREAWSTFHDLDDLIALQQVETKGEKALKFIRVQEGALKALEAGIDVFLPMQNKVILIPFPQIEVDDRQRLHCLTSAAAVWADGTKFYHLWGVRFEKDLWEQVGNGEISAKDILKLENIEQRMAALKVKGAESVIRELNGELIDTYEEYRLFKVKKVFSQVAYFLEYTCPSTLRVYVSGIDPEVGKKESALRAIAWKFGVTPKEYQSILAHA